MRWKSAIDDRSTSRFHSTLIASKCDHFDKTMLLLAFLDSPSFFFVLAMIEIVDCSFHRLPVADLHLVPFPFLHGTAVLLPSRQDGMERKHHCVFGGYCKYIYIVHRHGSGKTIVHAQVRAAS